MLRTTRSINRPKALAPICTTFLSDMSVHKVQILSLALAVLWSAVSVSCSYNPCYCANPAVRKEWRAFSTEEKAEWIRAVNVRINSHPYVGRFAEVVFEIQCLSKVPHDTALTPSVDPSISLIPPVNASSSYYDGILQSIGFTFLVGGSNCIFRLSVHPHGPEYSGRVERTVLMPFDLNVLLFRYIGRANSFPGIAGTYTSLRSH